jgi:hypothetical protein
MQGDRTKATEIDARPKSKSNLVSALMLAVVLGLIGLFIVPWIGIAAAMTLGKDGAFTFVIWIYATISIALVLWVGGK